MMIYRVTDPEFKPYGRILEGCNARKLLAALVYAPPLPAGTDYVPEDAALQSLPAAATRGTTIFGGLPVQFGWCNGHNTRLNCLEYHRSSEVLVGAEEFILLLAKQEEIEDGRLDTSRVKAFRVPPEAVVELYATTLHYAPCHADPAKGFRVLVILPQGTNTDKPSFTPATPEDRMLWAKNKWLLAHPDSAEAKAGAWIGLTGPNIDLEEAVRGGGQRDELYLRI
jgi:hypothetical protein